MFLLFGHDEYDASGGIEDLITQGETLEDLQEFIDDNPDKILNGFGPRLEVVYAYDTYSMLKHDYKDNQFNAVGSLLLWKR